MIWGRRERNDAEKISRVLSGLAEGQARVQLLAIDEARRRADEQYIQDVLARFTERTKPRQVSVKIPTVTGDVVEAASSLETMKPAQVKGGRASRDLAKAVGVEPTGGLQTEEQTIYPSGVEKTQAIEEAMTSLLTRATPRAAQTAQILGAMRPRVDLSTTLEEMLGRGQITEQKYKELKGAGRTPVQPMKIGDKVDKKTGKQIITMMDPVTRKTWTVEGPEVMPTSGQMGKIDEKIFTDPFEFDEAGNVTGVRANVTRANRMKLRNQLESEGIRVVNARTAIARANTEARLLGEEPDESDLIFVNRMLAGITQRINALSGKSLKAGVELPFGGIKSREEVEKTHEVAATRRKPITAPETAKKTKSGARFTFKEKAGIQ